MDEYTDEDLPLAGRLTLIGSFAAAVAAATLAARAKGASAPDRVHALDVVLGGIATHKLSRLISKAKVTAPARAPFTELEGPQGQSELSEKPRGEGLRYSVGELLTCPYCLDQWIAAGWAAGLVLAPRQTRLVAAAYSAEAIADFTHMAWTAARERV